MRTGYIPNSSELKIPSNLPLSPHSQSQFPFSLPIRPGRDSFAVSQAHIFLSSVRVSLNTRFLTVLLGPLTALRAPITVHQCRGARGSVPRVLLIVSVPSSSLHLHSQSASRVPGTALYALQGSTHLIHTADLLTERTFMPL